MNLYEKLNRLDDSLVESKRVVKKKTLTESYSNEMTEFMNWIQDYKNGALWNDFTSEFESEQDPDISVVLTWLENFDEDAYYDYVAADTYDDDIDGMLTETASFKSGDRYYGGLPSEPSMSEYGKAMDSARKNRDALLDKYDIKVDNDRSKGYTTYTGTINGHTFKYVEGHRDFSHWLSELVIDNKVVNPYKSSLNKIRKMFETNAVSISDIVHLLLKDNFDNIVYKEALTEGDETKTYKYPSGSPVFKFDKFLENTKEDFVTVATSIRKAKSNIESQIKSKLRLTQNTSIKIDETKIAEIDNSKPTNKQESP